MPAELGSRIQEMPTSGDGGAEEELERVKKSLEALKDSVERGTAAESEEVRALLARVEHIEGLHANESNERERERRADRLVAEHVMGEGQVDLGREYASERQVADLVDASFYQEVGSITASLEGGDPRPALAWCAKHRQKLRQKESMIEFRLRVKELLSLVHSGRAKDAIHHAREHLSPVASSSEKHLRELCSAMGCIALVNPCSSEPSWESLATLFKRDACRAHGLPAQGPLPTILQAGVTALKEPPHIEQERAGNRDPEDPFSYEEMKQIGDPLPHTKAGRSTVICPITREVMDEDNPPMVLPNGHVYSRRAMEEMAKKNQEHVFCVKTGGGPYDFSQLRRAYFA